MARQKADKALSERRVNDLLDILLDGAQVWEVFQFCREKQADPESNWTLAEGQEPLSDGAIRKYITRAYREMYGAFEKSRGKLLRRHLAKLNRVYSRAMAACDYSVARATLKDLAEIQRLLPNPADALQRTVDELMTRLSQLEQPNGAHTSNLLGSRNTGDGVAAGGRDTSADRGARTEGGGTASPSPG
jgi:hypothetical protein